MSVPIHTGTHGLHGREDLVSMERTGQAGPDFLLGRPRRLGRLSNDNVKAIYGASQRSKTARIWKKLEDQGGPWLQ